MKLSGTLRDIAVLKGHDKVVGILDALMGDYPELGAIPGRTITGTEYKPVLRKNNPQGGFRRANQGVDAAGANFAERLVQTFIYDNPIIVDKKVAEAHEDGSDEYLAIQSEAHVAGAFQKLGNQFYYGADSEDELGFPGLRAQINAFSGNTSNGEYDNTVNAGSSAANATSSAYLVRLGDDGVEYIFGRNNGLEVSPFMEQFVTDDDGKRFRAFIADMGMWIGLGVNHPRAAVRVANLDASGVNNGKVLNDKLGQAAFAKLPIAFKNDKAKLRWLVNSDQVLALQNSRTAINQQAYKLGAVADYPTELCNIPIIETNSILSTEAVQAFV